MALGTPGHADYRTLTCAGGTTAGCRQAVINALTLALGDLGGYGSRASWDGATLPNAKGATGATVESYDSVEHTALTLFAVPAIPWLNRPTFQQVIQITKDRTGN